MTRTSRVTNVADELQRAGRALAAPRALLTLGLYEDAVSRAYYSAYHCLRALFGKGIEPKTHAGALHLFNVELVRAGDFPPTYNRILAGMQRMREVSDYDASVVVPEVDARVIVRRPTGRRRWSIIEEAADFGDASRRWLTGQGFGAT